MNGIARTAFVLISVALSVNILRVVRDSDTKKMVLAGIGTFPGGQSTGLNSRCHGNAFTKSN